MLRNLILVTVGLGLLAGAGVVWSFWAGAQDRAAANGSSPVKPLPPTKPLEPAPARPRGGTDRGAGARSSSVAPDPDGAVRAALAKKIEIDLVDAPLDKLMEAFKAQTHLEIIVAAADQIEVPPVKPASPAGKAGAAAPAAPVTPAATVTAHLKGISASAALSLTLRDLGKSWAIDQGGITIADADHLPLVAEVYNVRDLVIAHPNRDDDATDNDPEPLIEVVTGAIATPSWAPGADPIQDCNPFHGTLTVDQDTRVQAQVAGLLAALRESRDMASGVDEAALDAGLSIDGADDAAVAAALDGNVEGSFHTAKLDDVAAWIRKSANIPVHIAAAARGADEPTFTVDLAKGPLSAALDKLLAETKLAYTIRDEALVITTKDAAQDFQSVRVYPVGDLIGGDVDRDGIDDEYAQLLDVITRSVAPDSWTTLEKAKAGTAYASYLPQGRAVICTQTREAHAEIAAILAKVRGAVRQQPEAKAAAAEPDAKKDRPLTMKIYKLNADLQADDFVTVVRDLVEPKSWTDEAYIHGVPGAIVVKQTAAIHKRVEKLLVKLGAIPDPKKASNSGANSLVGKQTAAGKLQAY